MAYQGIGRVSPNPLVGAVLVDRDYRLQAIGAHRMVGGLHAEAEILQDEWSVNDLQDSTLYVTLEPCAHQGRTPSCAAALAKTPLKRVIYGVKDPNPLVNGRGAAILNAAGIICEQSEMWQSECEALAAFFLKVQRTSTPFVGLKAAISLDGAIGRRGGRRIWLTGRRARAYGHFLRGMYDAIVVGPGTVAADNPTLDTRLAIGEQPWPAPSAVVLDSRANLLDSFATGELKMLTVEGRQVFWLVPKQANGAGDYSRRLRKLGVVMLPVDQQAELLSARSIVAVLFEQGIQSILLEGGTEVYKTFINDDLVDRLHLFQAPVLLGGNDLLPWSTDFNAYDRRGAATIARLEEDWLVEIDCRT